jgi:superfamily II DNA or RNA helicase
LTALPPLRRHQREALTVLSESIAADQRRSWIVLPPGAGKTRVGIDHARLLLEEEKIGSAVVFGPNTAIQGQWEDEWNRQCARTDSVSTDPTRADYGPAGTGRDLSAVFTALTYQSLAVFDDDRQPGGSLLDELAPGGRALVEALTGRGPLLLILDECHHLLEVWGRLLTDLLDLLPEVWVLGLTATPPGTMSAAQRELVTGLFSEIRYAASIPALVKEGDLAPFADLVWVTTPTPEEENWLAAQTERHMQFITSILEPDRGSIGFLEWADQRFLGTRAESVDWATMSRSQPELCDAALRLHHAQLLSLPPGARPGEQHRRDPDTDDWALLIDDWMRHHLLVSADAADHELAEAIKRALPAIGCRWTRHGITAGRSPVDRVLSYSASKPHACVDIVSTEAGNLGQRLRMLVLCDVESASATLSADVRTVLDKRSGSALLTLETLIDDPRTEDQNPLLVSGRTVAAAPEVLESLRTHIADSDPALASRLHITEPAAGVSRLDGRWTSRDWVPHVTAFFSLGGTQVLIGTRALLGEGWDAPAVTGLIDLSSATTSTAVTQTRGRALREDPHWAQKVALNWTVVCISPDHPRGDQDWNRLVRKHDGFFGTDSTGEIVDGVAHIDPAFSAFGPPEEPSDAINARMIIRSETRAEVAQRWDVGGQYRDEEIRSVRITPALGGEDVHIADVPARNDESGDFDSNGTDGSADADGIIPAPRHAHGDPGRLLPFTLTPAAATTWLGLGLLCILLAVITSGTASLVSAFFAVGFILSLPTLAAVAGKRRRNLYSAPPTVAEIAGAIADALNAQGLSTRGADAVRLRVDDRGELRCHLDADPASAETFALALDEAVSPIADPRYLLPSWHLGPRPPGLAGLWAQLRTGLGAPQQEQPVWMCVPSVLGAKKERAQAYARAWSSWVGGGEAVYTRNPDGAGTLVSVRGSEPLALTSVLRTSWR